MNKERSIADIRKSMRLTQTEFAELLNERQDTISRWENTDPDELSLTKKTWNKIDALTGKFFNRPKALNVADKWQEVEKIRAKLNTYLEERCAFLDYGTSITDMYRNIVKNSIRKPRIAFVGLSDVGKSTMINCLLGLDKMPANWTPVTAITVYIKHRDDRPNFIKDTAWIFKSDGTEKGFDLSHLNDEEKCKSLCMGMGDADILREYGTRDGDKYTDDVVAAVVYLDSPILKNVDLVDLPGYGTGDLESDEIATRGASEYADALVFLSRSNGFLSAQETTALRTGIQRLPCFESTKNKMPPLCNLFVVASQAHIVGNELDLQNILQHGRIRFEKTIPSTAEDFFKDRSDASGYSTEKYFQSRFFSYSVDAPEFRQKFEDALRALVERLPQCFIDRTMSLLRAYSKEHTKKLDSDLRVFTNMLESNDALKRDLAVLLKNEPERKRNDKTKRQKIITAIERYHKHSITEFNEAYNRVINTDFIVNAIKEKGFKKKKDDIGLLVNFLGTKLEGELDEILSKYSFELRENIDEYLGNFEASTTANGKIGINARIPFNAKRIFVSGMAGALAFGGLTLWASTLGNLAGYIIVAKGVSILSAIGIGLGGTAAVMPFVAAIGGPVTLFMVAAIVTAALFFTILSGGWQKNIAKKLVTEYDKKNAVKQYEGFITKFWINDTITAFNTAANAMETEWTHLVETHENLLNNSDIDNIQREIKKVKDMKSFLTNIPLPEGGFKLQK